MKMIALIIAPVLINVFRACGITFIGDGHKFKLSIYFKLDTGIFGFSVHVKFFLKKIREKSFLKYKLGQLVEEMIRI